MLSCCHVVYVLVGVWDRVRFRASKFVTNDTCVLLVGYEYLPSSVQLIGCTHGVGRRGKGAVLLQRTPLL